nr:hypothetical protein [Micromonospora sp. DSM 115978]
GRVTAAALAVLTPSRPPSADVWPVLTRLRGRDVLSPETYEDCLAVAPDRVRKSLRRLAPMVDRPADIDPEATVEAIGLRPAESAVFRLLRSVDVLVTSAAAVRVAARVAGTDANLRNVLTAGRIDLARLVGTGDEAPMRMAAIRHLGLTICTSSVPSCQSCPIASACASNGVTDGVQLARADRAGEDAGLLFAGLDNEVPN